MVFGLRQAQERIQDAVWETMKCVPLNNGNLSNPIMINKSEFLITIQKTLESDLDGVYKYKINENDWNLFVKFPINFNKIVIKSMCINIDKNELYFCGKGKLIKMNYDTKKFKIYDIKNMINEPCATLINSNLHFIGTNNEIVTTKNIYTAKCHFIWNIETEQLCKIHEFAEICEKLIYIPSLKQIFMFCCDMSHDDKKHVVDTIYVYNIRNSNRIWKRLDNVTFPEYRTRHWYGIIDCILSNDNKYILLFGTREWNIYKELELRHHVYGLKLDTMNIKYYESYIHFPKDWKGESYAIQIANTKNLLITGYVRQCNLFYHTLNIPHVIVEIIDLWFGQQDDFIYIMSQKDGKLSRIKENDLIASFCGESIPFSVIFAADARLRTEKHKENQ